MKNIFSLLSIFFLFASCEQQPDYDKAYNALRIINNYDDALAKARSERKPILLLFTLHGLSDRTHETEIWENKAVFNKLKDDFINIWLYCDDRRKIENEEFIAEDSITIGSKWAKLQQETFGEQSQPYFVIINADGKQISSKGIGYVDVRDGKLLAFLGKY